MILLATCNCGVVPGLKKAAERDGIQVELRVVTSSNELTLRASRLGVGLPCFVREDGAMSKDRVAWSGVPDETESDEEVDDVDDVEDVEDEFVVAEEKNDWIDSESYDFSDEQLS